MPRPALHVTFLVCAAALCARAGGPAAGLARAAAGDACAGAHAQGRPAGGASARRAGRRVRAPQPCAATAADSEASRMSEKTFDALLRRARAAGSVAVVVKLCVAFRPEGELSDEAARLQRAAIARAQDSLLEELRRERVGSVKRFESTPYIALTADVNALRRLRSSASVADVSEDAPMPAASR